MKLSKKLVLPVLAVSLITSSAFATTHKKQHKTWIERHPGITILGCIGYIAIGTYLFAKAEMGAQMAREAAQNQKINDAITQTTQEILLGSGI